MNAARKKAAEAMEKTDMVIEVLDARLPEASCNPMIEQLRVHRQRPCLKILNKSDLADPLATQTWLDYYNAQKNVHAVALSCKRPTDVAKIPGLCLKIAPHRGTALKPLRMMNMVLTDTPGMLWPKIAHPSDGLMLAASHAIGVNALIEEEVATFLADHLLTRYASLISARYGFPTEGIDGVSVVEGVALRRGFRLKGGGVDLEKAAHILLQDYRSGALGRISLETPVSRAALLASYQPPPSLALEREQEVNEVDEDAG
jgi:ribosome biogenesis GTPase A